jgi:hypothetical protein
MHAARQLQASYLRFGIARGGHLPLEQFQEKSETVFRPELRQDREIGRLCVSPKR